MGHMDVIGFISDGFNIYFPIAIVLLCAFSLFNIGTRILNVIGIQQFMVDDEITQELVDEGKELVRRGLISAVYVLYGMAQKQQHVFYNLLTGGIVSPSRAKATEQEGDYCCLTMYLKPAIYIFYFSSVIQMIIKQFIYVVVDLSSISVCSRYWAYAIFNITF